MSPNGGNDASPTTIEKDQMTSIRRKRFRRVKSTPLGYADAYSLPSQSNSTTPSRLKYVSNHLAPFRKVAIILCIYLGAGTICFYLLRHQMNGIKTNSILDAAYFTVVTMTSVGYGDLKPGSNITKLLACFFVVFGMLLIGLVLGKAADVLLEKQELLLEKAFNMLQIVGKEETLNRMENNKDNKVRNKFILLVCLLVVLIGAGTAILVDVEDLDLVHAFYCVLGTITSLGYIDIDKCFSTIGGRVFALFWILSGTICIGQLLFTSAVFLSHDSERERSMLRWVLKRKTTVADLEAADLDDDGVVVAAEFILYKLKEMGKFSQEDMEPIMKEFESLDPFKRGPVVIADHAFWELCTGLSKDDLLPPRL